MGDARGRRCCRRSVAKHLAPCLGTVQTEPVSIGAGEVLTFDGRGLPNLTPTGLRDMLTQPDGPLADLQPLRDKHLDRDVRRVSRSAGPRRSATTSTAWRCRARQARSLARRPAGHAGGHHESNRSDGQVVGGGDAHQDERLARWSPSASTSAATTTPTPTCCAPRCRRREAGVQRIATSMDGAAGGRPAGPGDLRRPERLRPHAEEAGHRRARPLGQPPRHRAHRQERPRRRRRRPRAQGRRLLRHRHRLEDGRAAPRRRRHPVRGDAGRDGQDAGRAPWASPAPCSIRTSPAARSSPPRSRSSRRAAAEGPRPAGSPGGRAGASG